LTGQAILLGTATPGRSNTQVVNSSDRDLPDSIQHAFICILEGELQGGVFQLDTRPVVIGSSPDVGVCLPDSNAHGRHAGIRYHEGRWEIHDLSGEGLPVNDIPTATRALDGGEIVTIGSTEIQFTLGDPRGTVATTSGEEDGNRSAQQQALLELVVERGDARDVGQRIPISSDTGMIIGRASEVELSLHDSHCSREHCRIHGGDEEVTITDLQSLNGTLVDGSRVATATLRAGDLILVGRTSIRCLKG